eukprot:1182550-Prorocentrum_minimum.AAC.3
MSYYTRQGGQGELSLSIGIRAGVFMTGEAFGQGILANHGKAGRDGINRNGRCHRSGDAAATGQNALPKCLVQREKLCLNANPQ